MALEYTGVPPAPRGMNLAGPSVFIDEAYCRWMQDVLVDRPGQIRMRGPMDYWYSLNKASLSSNEQILGMTETFVSDSAGNPQWRGAIFTAVNTVTNGSAPSSNAKMYVFKKDGTKMDAISLPFKLTTKYEATSANGPRWTSNTIIDAKPALGGGVWVGVIDDVNNTSDSGVSALFHWRGAGKADYDAGSSNKGTINLTDGDNQNLISHVSSVASYVEPGMFVFIKETGNPSYNYSYVGVVASVSTNNVRLEKNAIMAAYDTNAAFEILYTSFRGFVHQYGRGFASFDASGQYVTSGRLGSDAEGLFKAANVTVGGGSADAHRVRIYRNEDYQFIGTVKYNGTVSNTQVEVNTTSGSRATAAKDILEDEAYVIIRNDDTMYFNTTDGYSRRYPIDLTYRRPDMRPGKKTLNSNASYPSPAPGIFNSTYAGRQWFASFNTTNNQYDKFINRVVFSSPDNGENINLAPDASDSIIIPGPEHIRGIAGSTSGLLIFMESKTYIIRGTDRSNFSLEELYPDGCLSAPSIVQVGGGVIWAGKQGIYYYDGVSVRNFTPEALGIYYTDGIKKFDTQKDRVYALVCNNYLIINFTQWYSNYTLNRWEWSSHDVVNASEIITNTGRSCQLNPKSITFSIYLPTGSIGTLSNMTPRGFWTGNNVMGMNVTSNTGATSGATPAVPANSKGVLLDLKTIFTENIDDQTLDGNASVNIFTSPNVTLLYSNDTSYTSSQTISGTTYSGRRYNGPDFYLETKQYNWQEPTLRKWWRKLMFNIKVNKGIMMVEFVDINDNSLVDSVTGSSPPQYNSSDESGFFLIPATAYTWGYIEDQIRVDWDAIEDSGNTWFAYFAGKITRFSKWLGIRKNSLGFRLYSLRNYTPDTTTNTEVIPEIIDINDWVWGLKALRKGRN
jgi:hypothetical protein